MAEEACIELDVEMEVEEVSDGEHDD